MSLFRRPEIRYGRTPEPETPYQRAAQVWDDRLGSARVQAGNWRLVAVGALALLVATDAVTAAMAWEVMHRPIIPWVVQVDHLGAPQVIGPATDGSQVTDPEIEFNLGRFIKLVRSVPADRVLMRRDWLDAYDFTTPKGAIALNAYARADDPFLKAAKGQVLVTVSSVIRASPTSFRVAWTEQPYIDGALSPLEHWSAILTVAISPPHDRDHLMKNPLGVFVDAIDWSKELG